MSETICHGRFRYGVVKSCPRCHVPVRIRLRQRGIGRLVDADTLKEHHHVWSNIVQRKPLGVSWEPTTFYCGGCGANKCAMTVQIGNMHPTLCAACAEDLAHMLTIGLTKVSR